jgi:hypothetical protein
MKSFNEKFGKKLPKPLRLWRQRYCAGWPAPPASPDSSSLNKFRIRSAGVRPTVNVIKLFFSVSGKWPNKLAHSYLTSLFSQI